MHPVGKVFMAIGLVVVIIGGVMYAVGSENVDDVGEWDVREESEWNGQSGTYYFDGSEDMMVIVRNTVRCDTFELTIKDSTGDEQYYSDEYCTEDGTDPIYDNAPEGWHQLGTIDTYYVENGTYEINASSEVYLVPVGIWGEELGQAVGGFLSGVGGGLLVCCGGVLLFFGLILGLTVGEGGQKITVIQNGGMPMGGQMMQGGQMVQGGQMMQQTTMQQPVYQQVAQTPVQPQTTMQQPAEQTVWEQKSPENPF